MSQAGTVGSSGGGGGGELNTLTPDSGSVVTPVGGTIAITGYPQTIGGVKGIETFNGGAATFQISNLDAVTPYMVGTNADTAPFTTIQGAIDQAIADGASSSTPAVVWITSGTYIEDLNLQPYVNLISTSQNSTVIIQGAAVFSGTGLLTIENVSFNSTTDSPALSLQSSEPSIVDIRFVDFFAGAPLLVASTTFESIGDGITANLIGCTFNPVIHSKCLNINNGEVEFFNCISSFTNVASTISNDGVLTIFSSDISDSFTVTEEGLLNIYNSTVESLADPCIFLNGDDSNAYAFACQMGSSAANFVTGTGTFIYGDLVAISASTTIENTVTQQGQVGYFGNFTFDGGNTTLNADGQLWIGSTSKGIPIPSTLTAGTGVSIVNASGSITISATAFPFTWNITTSSISLVSNHGYVCASTGGALSLALPATSTVGDIIEITLDGATSFTITQGGSQSIVLGNKSTTTGVGGSVASTQQGDSLRMVCSVTNLRWNILSSIGNLTVV